MVARGLCSLANRRGVTPDIACYAKGLTGGALPLAVTLCKREIFDAHYSPDRARAFFHSSSYMANPIACAAALANLDIWATGEPRARVERLCALQEERLARFADDERFSDVRRLGTITALDLRAARTGYLATIGLDLMRFFNERGLLLRPLGATIYVLPPYCIEAGELDLVYDAIDEAADRFASLKARGQALRTASLHSYRLVRLPHPRPSSATLDARASTSSFNTRRKILPTLLLGRLSRNSTCFGSL